MMSGGGVPFANVAVITLYERVIAAIVSGLTALAGAYFLFGHVYIDPSSGGAFLIELMVGLVAATTVGTLIGYGKTVATKIFPQNFSASLIWLIGVAILVQLPIMVGNVSLAFVVPFTLLFFTKSKAARTEPASAMIVLCFATFAMMSIPADILYQRTFWLLIGAAVALLPSKNTYQPLPKTYL